MVYETRVVQFYHWDATLILLLPVMTIHRRRQDNNINTLYRRRDGETKQRAPINRFGRLPSNRWRRDTIIINIVVVNDPQSRFVIATIADRSVIIIKKK